jgi:hypothetical protein
MECRVSQQDKGENYALGELAKIVHFVPKIEDPPRQPTSREKFCNF